MVSISVGRMTNKVHTVNSVFDTNLRRIPKDRMAQRYTGKQATSFKNAINQKVSAVGTITLQVRMGDSRVGVVFVVVHNLAIPVLLGTSFIDRFVRGIFSPERKIVAYKFQTGTDSRYQGPVRRAQGKE